MSHFQEKNKNIIHFLGAPRIFFQRVLHNHHMTGLKKSINQRVSPAFVELKRILSLLE